MKLTAKGILVVSAGALSLATGAFAQEVESTKVAPIQNLLPNAYGKVELRHELDVAMQDTKVDGRTPNVSLRPTLGSTFFDGDLDTSFTWIFEKKAETSTVDKTYLYNVTTYNLLSGDYGSITPYAEIYQTTPSSNAGAGFVEAYLGSEFSAKYKLETAPGAITFSAYSLPLVAVNSKAHTNRDKLRNETGIDNASFALAEEAEVDDKGELTVERRDPAFDSYTGAGVSFAPAALAGASVALGTELYRGWAPDYVAETVDGESVTALDGYNVSNNITNKLTLSYKLNDKVSMYNQTRQYIDGVYEAGVDGKRWENRLGLTASLF